METYLKVQNKQPASTKQTALQNENHRRTAIAK